MQATPRVIWTIIVSCGLVVTLTFGCGHRIELKSTADSSPQSDHQGHRASGASPARHR